MERNKGLGIFIGRDGESGVCIQIKPMDFVKCRINSEGNRGPILFVIEAM